MKLRILFSVAVKTCDAFCYNLTLKNKKEVDLVKIIVNIC